MTILREEAQYERIRAEHRPIHPARALAAQGGILTSQS